MRTYIINKLTSFAFVAAVIGGTFLAYGSGPEQWQAILIAIVIFGYGHFLLGFYYQIKGFFRTDRPWRLVVTFLGLTAFSIALAELLFEHMGFVAALFIGFVYFLFHGLLNEQTLIKRQTGAFVPLLSLTALAVFVMALLTYSVPDRTFFFDRTLTFSGVSTLQAESIFESLYLSLQHFSDMFWGGVAMSFTLISIAWYRYRETKLQLFFFGLIASVTLGVLLLGPPSYIYMYLFVVGYHFMTWLLFYLVEMHRRGSQAFQTFVIQNLILISAFLIGAAALLSPRSYEWATAMFDYKYFVVATYVHITTSFMNDDWFWNVTPWLPSR